MKVLLSAYSCRPGFGSELGVGWRWARELAATDHDVWLLTRTIFRPYLEDELRARPLPRLRIAYYDPPGWISPKGAGIYAHYYAWQIGALFTARSLCATVQFDIVHHITLGVFRQPSLLYLLPIPFVFGPVGGAESAPIELRRELPIKGQLVDLIRDAVNRLSNLDPFLRALYSRAHLILCKTEDTRRIIPRRFLNKAIVQREIGIDSNDANAGTARLPHGNKTSFQILYVGRLIYWKGLSLGLQAFARLLKDHPDAQLSIIGTGPDEKWLRHRATQLRVDRNTRWLGQMPHEILLQQYLDYDVFLFPSLHDSSGNVVLEAMNAGLPVVCLDLGGPPTMVDDTCGCVIPARFAHRKEVIARLGDALARIAEDNEYRLNLASGAKDKARAMSWHNTVTETYRLIEASILGKNT